MLNIKSLRNVAIGAAAILLFAWTIQLFGSAIYSLSPSIYSSVLGALDSAHTAPIKHVSHSLGLANNFFVGFGLIFAGLLTVGSIATLYSLLELTGRVVVEATKQGDSNGIA